MKGMISAGMIGVCLLAGVSLAADAQPAARDARTSQERTALQLMPAPIQRMWDFAGVDENGEAWIDGSTLRFLFGEFLEEGKSAIAPLISELQGVRLSRDSERLYIELEYGKTFTVSVRDEDGAPDWQLYGIRVPSHSKFSLQVKDGVLDVEQETGPDPRATLWSLLVKMPGLPDRIYVHGTTLDLMTGDGTVTAGFLGDLIQIVATTRLKETNATFEGISFWQSLLESLRFDQRAPGAPKGAVGSADDAEAGA